MYSQSSNLLYCTSRLAGATLIRIFSNLYALLQLGIVVIRVPAVIDLPAPPIPTTRWFGISPSNVKVPVTV